jgi:hypothetical protein
VAVAALCVLALAEKSSPAESQPVAAYYTTGLGTPVGISGVEIVAGIDRLELSAGLGVGLLAVAGERALRANALQWSVMPRVWFGGDSARHMTGGVGVSGGGFGAAQGCNFVTVIACHTSVEYVIWMNGELGWETLSPGGLALRYFAGFGYGFGATQRYAIPYAGLSFGYAWPD